MIDQKVINALNHLADILGHAASKYGPEAINLSIQYIHYNSIIALVNSSLTTILGILLLILVTYCFIKVNTIINSKEDCPMSPLYLLGGVFFSFLGITIFLMGASHLLSSSVWLGIFAPKLALVRMAFHSAGVH